MHFLSIPSELQIWIYTYLLLQNTVITERWEDMSQESHIHLRRARFNLHLTILQTCSFIQNEASEILYSNTIGIELFHPTSDNPFHVNTYMYSPSSEDDLNKQKMEMIQAIRPFWSLFIKVRCNEAVDVTTVHPLVNKLCDRLSTMSIKSLEIGLRLNCSNSVWEILMPFNQLWSVSQVKILGEVRENDEIIELTEERVENIIRLISSSTLNYLVQMRQLLLAYSEHCISYTEQLQHCVEIGNMSQFEEIRCDMLLKCQESFIYLMMIHHSKAVNSCWTKLLTA